MDSYELAYTALTAIAILYTVYVNYQANQKASTDELITLRLQLDNLKSDFNNINKRGTEGLEAVRTTLATHDLRVTTLEKSSERINSQYTEIITRLGNIESGEARREQKLDDLVEKVADFKTVVDKISREHDISRSQ